MKYKYLALVILLATSCNQKKEMSLAAAAIIDTDTLYTSMIDINIQNELYQGLFGIYYYRKIALEEVLKERLLDKEAKNNNITQAQLIEKEVDNKLSENGLQQFIKDNKLEGGFPDPNNPIRAIDSNSEYGKNYIKKLYQKYTLDNYIISLKKKYKVKSYLAPPLPPRKDLSGIEKHFKGNVKSTTSMIIASAFDCPQCVDFHPIYQRLYKKYNDKVKFGQVHFSPEVNLPIMVSEYAHQQGKFWEMYDLIYEQHPKDTVEYFQLAKQIGLDSVHLSNYLNNSEAKGRIQTNLEALMAEDIIRTPSILINDRLYYGGFSFEKISEYLDEELRKNI